MLRIPLCLILQTLLFLTGLVSPSILLAGTDLNIPKPTDTLLPPPPAPALEPSAVHITVARTVRELREAVETSIAVHHRHEEEWIPAKRKLDGMPFEYKYYLWRGPINFRTDGNRLVTEFPDVRYRVRVRLTQADGTTKTAECGYGPDAHMRMQVEAYSELHWNEDWSVQTKTTFGEPRFAEPCRLAPADIDATEMLNAWFDQRLPHVASAVDATFLKYAEAKKRAQTVWDKFQEPLELGADVWLTYRPRTPRAASWTLNADQSIHTIVSMVFDPLIKAGGKPAVETTPLPRLQTGPSAKPGFHLSVPLVVPYEELTQRVAKEAAGSEINPPVGSKILVTGVQVYGSGNHLITEVTVTGGVNGKLYIQGTPTLSPDGQTLIFGNFEFTLDTSNLLVKATNRMMHNSIREKVLPHTQIDIRDRIAVLRSRIERQMNRELAPGIWLEGKITKLEPRGIYPVPGGMEIQFVTDGTLNLVIQ